MTRKKYIKRLMALGVSRNRANVMATACRGPGGKSYAQDFADREPWLRLEYIDRRADKGMAVGFQGVVLSARKAGQTFRAWLASQVLHHPKPHHPDSLDALRYNMQVMDRAEHAALHAGQRYRIDEEAERELQKPEPMWTKENPHIGGGGND